MPDIAAEAVVLGEFAWREPSIWFAVVPLVLGVLVLGVWVTTGWFGSRMATRRGHRSALGWLLGLTLGPVGLLFLARLGRVAGRR